MLNLGVPMGNCKESSSSGVNLQSEGLASLQEGTLQNSLVHGTRNALTESSISVCTDITVHLSILYCVQNRHLKCIRITLSPSLLRWTVHNIYSFRYRMKAKHREESDLAELTEHFNREFLLRGRMIATTPYQL